MRLNESPRVPSQGLSASLAQFLHDQLRAIAQKVNQIGDGRIAGSDLCSATVPTSGTFAKGDFISNSAPSELGTAGQKYVITGWMCVTAGTPGTLVECRSLTGN